MTSVLFVCTGNQCRSPMAAALAGLLVGGREDLAGRVTFASAGLLPAGRAPSPGSVKVMATRGLDVSSHRSRRLGDALVPTPDLILTMTREHARAVVEASPRLLGRTFTLRSFVDLADLEGPRCPGEALVAYLARIGVHRRLADLAGASAADEVADPSGKDRAAYERCAAELETMIGTLIEHTWPPGASEG